VKVTWRYDYFLAFENLHDFYPRVADDDAGFSAELPADAAAHLGMRARARLTEPVISESTTFWKATHGNPIDFTLKKRYLIAILEEVLFVDTKDDRIRCRIARGAPRCSALLRALTPPLSGRPEPESSSGSAPSGSRCRAAGH
jgi:hypothetical protein